MTSLCFFLSGAGWSLSSSLLKTPSHPRNGHRNKDIAFPRCTSPYVSIGERYCSCPNFGGLACVQVHNSSHTTASRHKGHLIGYGWETTSSRALIGPRAVEFPYIFPCFPLDLRQLLDQSRRASCNLSRSSRRSGLKFPDCRTVSYLRNH